MSSHIRGRVRYAGYRTRTSGRRVWLIEVINTTTGKVVVRDNTCGLANCCDSARRFVAVARDAYVLGIRSRDLKARRTVA